MSRFEHLPEFAKELKRLTKKFRTLPSDLEVFEGVLSIEPTGIGANFTIVHHAENCLIVKARLASRSLQGDRAFRVVYAYHPDRIQFMYIELYHKGEKENEDRERYRRYAEGG